MLIYSPHISPRLLYIATWLGEQTGTTPVCTDNKTFLKRVKKLKSTIPKTEFPGRKYGLNQKDF
ncbi:MAG: hypothetical protein ACK50E_07010 [Bacteroidota bacterium]